MTLLDLIVHRLIRSDAQAERFASDLLDLWHDDRIPGELADVLGLSPREYQAWTTGGVSLLTIAAWKRTGSPALDGNKPWFKLSGRPGREKVGYLEQLQPRRRANGLHSVRLPDGRVAFKAPRARRTTTPHR